MFKKLTLLSALLIAAVTFQILGGTTFAAENIQIEAKQLDPRAQILADYLAQYDSPLQYHAQDFIDAADTYRIDWRWVPAISGVESTFGKFTPGGYNAWGWGVYGDQAIYFTSWRNAIFTVTRGLKEGYIDKGLTDPYSMNRVYAASPYWGGHVDYFMHDLQAYTNTHQIVAETPVTQSLIKIAGTSAQLAMR